MTTKKMCSLTIRIKKNDMRDSNPLWKAILEAMISAGIGGATVWQGIDGFGKRGASTFQKDGLTYDAPMMIEIVDEREKIESLAPELKKMIGGNGLLTFHDVEVLL